MASRVAEEARDFREFLDQLRSEPGYWKHYTIIQFTTAMARLMNKPPRISGRKLAQLLRVTPPSVSKALSGGENLTVETMTKMAGAIDAAVHIHVAKKGVLVRWLEDEARESVHPLGGAQPTLAPEADLTTPCYTDWPDSQTFTYSKRLPPPGAPTSGSCLPLKEGSTMPDLIVVNNGGSHGYA